MDALFATMRKLHPRGPGAHGLVVDEEGVMLGPDCVLVERTAKGYRRVGDDRLVRLQDIAFGRRDHHPSLPLVLDRIVGALDEGDLVRAQLLGLSLRLRNLDDDQLRRLRLTAALLKSGYDPDEPRDEDGRWTSDGGASPPSSSPSALPPLAPATAAASSLGSEAAASVGAAVTLAEDLAPFWARAAVGLGGGVAVATLGAVLVPLNRSNVSAGMLPGSADINYRYDEGILTLTYRDADGKPVALFNDRPGADGLYRDSDGNVIARQLANGEGFVLAPDALPGLAAKAKGKASDKINRDAMESLLRAYTEAIAATQPRLCPPPSPDRGASASVPGALYQMALCGMPPDWGVEFNGARFDGCHVPTGTMLECKGPAFDGIMKGSVTDDWPWPAWFTTKRNKSGELEPTGMTKMVQQMQRLNDAAAAGGRDVIWYVAEPKTAEWLRLYALRHGYAATNVVHVPMPPINPEWLRRFAVGAFPWHVEAIA